MLFDKELDSFFIICFLEKNPPSLHCLAFDTGDECSPTLPLAFFMSIG